MQGVSAITRLVADSKPKTWARHCLEVKPTMIQTLPRLDKNPKIVKWLSGVDGYRTWYRLELPALHGKGWDGRLVADQVLVRRLPGVGHGVQLSSCLHVLEGKRYSLVVWYTLVHICAHWYTLVQFGEMVARGGGLVPTRIKIGPRTHSHTHAPP